MSEPVQPHNRLRQIFAASLAILAIAVFLVAGKAAPSEKATPEASWLKKQIESQSHSDPDFARRLEEARLKYGDWPTAIALRSAETGDKKNPSDALLAKLAKDLKEGKVPDSIELAKLQRVCGGEPEGFFTAHGTCVQLTNEARQLYLVELNRAISDASIRSLIRDDPVGISVWTQAPSLLEYYSNNRDWLAEVLVQLESEEKLQNKSNDSSELNPIRQILEVCQKHHPLPKQAAESGLGAIGVGLFIPYGDLIQEVVRSQVPVLEVLEVLFANQVAVDQIDPSKRATWLVELHKKYPNEWRMAQDYPGVLEFMEVTKDGKGYELGKSLLEKYGPQLPIQLLGQTCAGAMKPAAQALNLYGDVAIYVFQRYAIDERLQKLLNDSTISHRAVPYLFQFGDAGFDRLKDNVAWLDKYFDAEGKPKEPEWWTHVPLVGGPANVIRNWATGKPNEWSELGWATLDVADGALLILSFGASSALTTTAKEAGKEAGETVAKSALRTEAAGLSKQAARTTGRITRSAEQASMEQATKTGGRYAESSLIKRTLSYTQKSLSVPWKIIKVGVLVLSRTGTAAVEAARTINATWKAVPTKVRVWVYRAALGATLFISIQHRVVPNWPSVRNGVLESIKTLAQKTAETIGMLLAEAARFIGEIAAPILNILWMMMLRYVLPVILLLGAARMAFGKRRVQYV